MQFSTQLLLLYVTVYISALLLEFTLYEFSAFFSTLEGLFRKAALGVQCRYVIRRESSDRYVRAALRGGLQLVTIAKRLAALGSDLQTPAYIRRARS